MITASQVNELRQITGVGMMECKKALTEAAGDMAKAADILRKSGAAKAAKRADKEAKEGTIGVYIHSNNKIATMVELNCETDFVARNDEFIALAKELAMQVAAMNPKYVRPEEVPAEELAKEQEIYRAQLKEEGKPAEIVEKILAGKVDKYYSQVCLLKQPSIKDDKTTAEKLINGLVAKIGEKVEIGRVFRIEI
ncbi:MAG: translation elongation factor Ts [Candidatus Gracilibacteria bacterium]|nr:translation elongation factor Ts [Candidatus Gracilibacteria bacterium]